MNAWALAFDAHCLGQLLAHAERLAYSCAGGIIGPFLIEALSDECCFAAAMITLCDFSHSVPGLLSWALIAWLFPVQVASLGLPD